MFRYLYIVLVFTAFSASCTTSPMNQPFGEVQHTEFDITACLNGTADSYPCSNIDLYAQLTPEDLLGNQLNDVWAWKDSETKKEYALVGMNDGVTIVDISEPDNPVVIGKLIEPPGLTLKFEAGPVFHHDDGGGFKKISAWRDIKVYKDHMFVISEQNDHGLQIFDLRTLKNITAPPVELTNYLLYNRFGNAHNIAINENTGFAYVIGATNGEICARNGALHIINISTPASPEFAGCHFEETTGGITRAGYLHDTQCVVYNGGDNKYLGRELCFNSGETTLMISDVTDKENPNTVSNSSFEGSSYLHQGWLSEDHNYFFMNDEGDERKFHHPTRTYIWELQNLENPTMAGFYEHPTLSVDHNLYIKEGLMYQANYSGGLRILDISNPDPDQIGELGFFDTTPGTDAAIFTGLWSVYPWLDNGKIIVSDINNGLFILKFNQSNE